MRKILLLLILFNYIFSYTEIPDLVTKVATTSGNWLKLETGARAVGMGGAQVAAATGVSAVSYNPADQWPKYGTYVISIGMTIHFVQRLIAYLRRSARSRKKNKREDKGIEKNNKDSIKELYEKI